MELKQSSGIKTVLGYNLNKFNIVSSITGGGRRSYKALAGMEKKIDIDKCTTMSSSLQVFCFIRQILPTSIFHDKSKYLPVDVCGTSPGVEPGAPVGEVDTPGGPELKNKILINTFHNFTNTNKK